MKCLCVTLILSGILDEIRPQESDGQLRDEERHIAGRCLTGLIGLQF
jgi:hypothetical protein